MNFYTFSFNNPIRKADMERQFKAENIQLTFIEPVASTDPRLVKAPDNIKRTWGIMFSHLDMLETFLHSDAEFGIFCEDDILLYKNIETYLPEIIAQFKRHNLNILLLSYLTTYKLLEQKVHPHHQLQEPTFACLTYGDDTWGAHMYMLSKASAKQLHDTYTLDYAVRTLTDPHLAPFSPDWTLTKDGKRALLYPMLGLEKGETNTDHYGQATFHRQCFETHFNSDLYHQNGV